MSQSNFCLALGLQFVFPTEIGHLSKLFSLAMSSNSLQGRIPTEIGLLRNVRVSWAAEFIFSFYVSAVHPFTTCCVSFF